MTPDTRSVLAWLRARVAADLGVRDVDVDVDVPFADLGLDSARIGAVAGDLRDQLGLALDSTAAFEFPTVADLARALTTPRRAAARPPAAPAPATAADAGDAADDVAIVGIGCRVPGAAGPEELWELLEQGRDAVCDPPATRRPDGLWPVPAGLVDAPEAFDAGFFGISAGEAERIDPQQRLLLEVCWEAFEDAGERPERLRGSATGVFVGISAAEYLYRQLAPGASGAHTAMGASPAVAANRLSFVYDLRGPSLAVDTACSSSLVALHLADTSLRRHEIDRAVVGGVNVLLEPELAAGLAAAGMVSPTGRCRPFGVAADGYVRSEGCVVVVLKRLHDARRDGDRVYAVVRGTAVNQDGRSNGLTAPNPAAQRAVLEAAYRAARVAPTDVQYVECHGTGTQLGDSIEAASLGAVVAWRRPPASPCRIGSIKGNLGHLEAAAGLAGLIKVALALRHGRVPPTVHADRTNPRIDFPALALEVASAGAELRGPAAARLAGVSSFGFGGTNAHAVLQGVADDATALGRSGPMVLALSAPSPAGLERLAAAWQRRLADAGDGEAAQLAMASSRRTVHRHRLAVAGSSAGALATVLRRALSRGSRRRDPVGPPPRIGLVFTGQGAGWDGSAPGLLETLPLVASVIRRCDEAVADRLGWSIETALRERSVDANDTAVAQPLIVAVQLATAELLRACGVVPAGVVGHSLGELSAATVAGMLDLPTAMALAVARGRAMVAPGTAGAMLAVGLEADEARREASVAGVSLAAVNGPGLCVLSGDRPALDAVAGRVERMGRFVRWLDVRYAFHSDRMAGAAARFAAMAGPLAAGDARLPMYSTVLGRRLGPSELTPEYLGRNVRETVSLAQAVSAMVGDGVDLLLEVGPAAALIGSLRRTVGATEPCPVLAALPAGRVEADALAECLGELFEAGTAVRWHPLLGGRRGPVSLPLHPWDHERHWRPRRAVDAGPTPAAGLTPLPGEPLDLGAGDLAVWAARLDTQTHPVLQDHRVDGGIVLPAAATVELALAVARHLLGPEVVDLELVRWEGVVAVDQVGVDLQTSARRRSDGGSYDVSVDARPLILGEGSGWRGHAGFRLTGAGDAPRPRRPPQAAVPLEGDVYGDLRRRGLSYGPRFRLLSGITREGRVVHGHLDSSGAAGEALAATRVVDAAFHLAAALPLMTRQDRRAWVPAEARRIRLWADPATASGATASMATGADAPAVDVTLWDTAGNAVAEVTGLVLRPLGQEAAAAATDGSFWYEVAWRPRGGSLTVGQERARARSAGAWVVIGRHAPDVREAAAALRARVGDMVLACPDVEPAEALVAAGAGRGAVAGVVHCVAPEDHDLGRSALHESLAVLRLVQAATQLSQPTLPAVVVVSFAAGDAADAVGPVAASCWGLLRTIRLEHPLLPCRAVELEGPADLGRLADEIASGSQDAEVVYRAGRPRLPRLVAASRRACNTGRPAFPADGMYVVTGGTGALGALAAEWLAGRGARKVALLARRPNAERVSAQATRLAALGCHAVAVAVDVAAADAVATALDELRAQGPLKGVIHAAGALDDRQFLAADGESVTRVFAGKVLGAWNLHVLTADDPLDHFVLYASAAGVLGSPGQSAYAAANAFLDGLAHRRRAAGMPALSVDWGPWAGAGMGAALADGGSRRGLRTAISGIAADAGLAALEGLVQDQRAQTAVLGFDLRQLLQYYPSEVPPFFEEVNEERALKTVGVEARARPEMHIPYVAPRTEVERRIAEIWQRSLGIEPIGVHDRFFDLGGDSVFANQIILEINRSLGVEVVAGDAFTNLTVEHVAALAERWMARRVEEMSEGEVMALLAGGPAPTGGDGRRAG